MRARVYIIILLLIASELFSVEIITLEKGINLGKKMEENGVFVRLSFGYDFDDSYLYIPDFQYGTILKVEISSGRLSKTISSKGQGPGELERPVQVIEKNNKLYVLDRGFNGIKIFDKDGKYISSFHILPEPFPTYLWFSESFAVSEKGEIFVAIPDLKENKLVSIYEERSGKRIRALIDEDLARIKDRKEFIKNCVYGVRIDKEGNIYLLFPLRKLIKKFTMEGELLWEKFIENELLKKAQKEAKEELIAEKGVYKIKAQDIYSFEVSENGTIIISHRGGGSVFDKNGNLSFLLKGLAPFIRIKGFNIIKNIRKVWVSYILIRMPEKIQRIL